MTNTDAETSILVLPRAQRAALMALHAFIQEKRYAPSLVELGERLHVTDTSVRSSLRFLAKKGLVEVVPRISRGLTITSGGAKFVKTALRSSTLAA